MKAERQEKELIKIWNHLFGLTFEYKGKPYLIVGVRLEYPPMEERFFQGENSFSINLIPTLVIMSGLNKVETIPLKDYVENIYHPMKGCRKL